MPKVQLLIAFLLLVSGVTHITQLWFYELNKITIGAALFGIVYFIIGALLLIGFRIAVLLSAVIPLIGALGGMYRYLKIERLKLIIFHLMIDIIVITLSFYLVLLRY